MYVWWQCSVYRIGRVCKTMYPPDWCVLPMEANSRATPRRARRLSPTRVPNRARARVPHRFRLPSSIVFRRLPSSRLSRVGDAASRPVKVSSARDGTGRGDALGGDVAAARALGDATPASSSSRDAFGRERRGGGGGGGVRVGRAVGGAFRGDGGGARASTTVETPTRARARGGRAVDVRARSR